jgi:hypothetical protein
MAPRARLKVRRVCSEILGVLLIKLAKMRYITEKNIQ